jgi:hypothetical protein
VAFFWFVLKTDNQAKTVPEPSTERSWAGEMLVVGGLWMLLTIVPLCFPSARCFSIHAGSLYPACHSRGGNFSDG